MAKSEAKAVNYPAEMVERMVEVYTSAESDADRAEAVKALATETGKTVRSITAKLSSLGVYRKAEKVTKTGAKVETKAEIVGEIASALDLDTDAVASLANASKAALTALRSAVK